MQALQPLLAAGPRDDGNSAAGAEFPRVVEWTCHRVLAIAGDADGAAAWLARAHEALRAQATSITDASVREDFLRNIPVHREIVATSETRTNGR